MTMVADSMRLCAGQKTDRASDCRMRLGRHGHAAHRQHAQVDVAQALAALQAQASQMRQIPQRVHACAARPPAAAV